MRFMILVKADESTEAGKLPDPSLLAAMGEFNEQLVKAGVMQAGEGLQPTSKGARVQFTEGRHVVTDGPFRPAREQVAGFWIWDVKSKAEAIEWVKKCPPPMGPGKEAMIEIRPLYEAADFDQALAPELHAREELLREQLATKT